MADIFKIEMLPAREGDCLMLTWGESSRPNRMLVDGGRFQTYSSVKQRIKGLPDTDREFELLVISHIDRDHVEGALAMLEDPDMPAQFRDIWFNGYDHLLDPNAEVFGAVQGERVTAAILEKRLAWNKAFGGKAIETDPLNPSSRTLNGGLNVTLLSPNRKKLSALAPLWKQACEEEGLVPGVQARRETEGEGWESFGRVDIKKMAELPFHEDDSASNGTSIAVLAEYKQKRVLLAADAHPSLLQASLTSVVSPGEKLSLGCHEGFSPRERA